MILDFDRFKVVNDSLGHTAGDQMLVAIANRLQSIVRGRDTVARLGGDEFAILAENVADPTAAEFFAQRIQEQLRAPFLIAGQEIFATVSIGIALSRHGTGQPGDLLREADTAMYRAKESGRGRHAIFDSAMREDIVSRMRLESDLWRALDRGEFQLKYQPIVELQTRRIAGIEALVRWYHPERGELPPSTFIPVAEEIGAIGCLGRWVLREACRQIHAWRCEDHADSRLTMSVNLSGRQLADPCIVEQVDLILAETGLAPSALQLEVTESVAMEDAEAAILVLKVLSAKGIRLGIDDFGTGYSSLSHLHRFPFDTLKVDRSFVGRMETDACNSRIVPTIVSLAHILGMEVIAEGIETEGHLAALVALGCRYGQGYLFSKPLSASRAVTLLEVTVDLNFREPE
jgi:diguanylate cyclase (GGDEF)-like protein